MTKTFDMCPHFGICGGCAIQNLAYAEQLRTKDLFVREWLEGLGVPEFLPILPSPEIVFYRNKMEYSFGDERDVEILNRSREVVEPLPVVKGAHLGLHPKGRFSLVTPTPQCFLLSPEAQRILRVISEWATRKEIPVYLRKDHSGILRHVVIREGKNTGERMVNLVSTSDLPAIQDLAVDLKNCGIPITTFIWTMHDGLSDVAQGDINNVVWGEGVIHERVGDVVFKLSLSTFMQTNTHAAEGMIEFIHSWLPTEGLAERVLLDLYCGGGSIGLNLAAHFKKMIGIDNNPFSIKNAQENAGENGRVNVEFIKGNVEDWAKMVLARAGAKPLVILDPPRVGVHKRVIDALLKSPVPDLIYISCNPETLARDCQELSAKYKIQSARPMDFFPHTDHVETAVKLSN